MDKRTMKILASDKKREILKRLSKSRMTLSDLKNDMGMSFSTIKGHLDEIKKAGLIEQKDDEHKWKYYELTRKGRYMTSPSEKRIFILLGISLLCAASSGFYFIQKLTGYMNPSMLATEAGPVLAATPVREAVSEIPYSGIMQFPFGELAIFMLFVFGLGICMGIIIGKRQEID